MDPKASRELSRGAVRTARSLCVRLHSLGYCLTQLAVLSHLIDERWQGVQQRRAAYGREARALPRTVLHAGAPEAVMPTVDELCRFIGAKARRRAPEHTPSPCTMRARRLSLSCSLHLRWSPHALVVISP